MQAYCTGCSLQIIGRKKQDLANPAMLILLSGHHFNRPLRQPHAAADLSVAERARAVGDFE